MLPEISSLNYLKNVKLMAREFSWGKLKLCLYGTRDAALNWQQTLNEHLLENSFERIIGFPSVFYHPARDVWTLGHGDDCCSSGDESALHWLEGVLSKKYELKTPKVGHLPGMSREGQILNRIVRATPAGFELEAGGPTACIICSRTAKPCGR